MDTLQRENLKVVQATAKQLDPDRRLVHLSDGTSLSFDRLCLCCGATPKVRLPRRRLPCSSCMAADSRP